MGGTKKSPLFNEIATAKLKQKCFHTQSVEWKVPTVTHSVFLYQKTAFISDLLCLFLTGDLTIQKNIYYSKLATVYLFQVSNRNARKDF